MDYVKELRQLVGTRPLVLTGSCVFVCDREGRVLLNKRSDNGYWGVPGGMMELGETLEQTGIREVQEETGLTVKRLHLLDVFSGPELYYRYPHGDEVYNVTAAYRTDEYEGEVRVNEESEELRFFALAEMPPLEQFSPPLRPFIARFLQEKGVVV
ncbi:MAG TPA: NUDIX hydrolase [Bacilli bacterium]|nr:NUDIX hydrolase [Bacilli bacterium]